VRGAAGTTVGVSALRAACRRGGRRCRQGGRAARGQAGGRAARGRYLFGPAASWAMARHCRAKIGGAVDPATSLVSALVVATSASRRATMHDATRAFRRAMTIGAAKSVSFEKKQC